MLAIHGRYIDGSNNLENKNKYSENFYPDILQPTSYNESKMCDVYYFFLSFLIMFRYAQQFFRCCYNNIGKVDDALCIQCQLALWLKHWE